MIFGSLEKLVTSVRGNCQYALAAYYQSFIFWYCSLRSTGSEIGEDVCWFYVHMVTPRGNLVQVVHLHDGTPYRPE